MATAPLLNMEIEGVVARIQSAANEPTVKRLVAVVENLFPLSIPVNGFRCFAPETGRIS